MWIAKDVDSSIFQYKYKPIRCTDCWMPDYVDDTEPILISDAESKIILGKEIKWCDEPIKIDR